MNKIEIFFLAIGYYNLIGSFLLYAMLSSKLADKVLRNWFQIIAFPYDIGKHGSLWLFWAATTNLFYSYINIVAASFEQNAQFHILLGDVIVYSVFYLLAIAAMGNENYLKGGIVTSIGLFTFWLGWGVYLLVCF